MRITLIYEIGNATERATPKTSHVCFVGVALMARQLIYPFEITMERNMWYFETIMTLITDRPSKNL